LAHHNDWSRWFVISSPPPIWCHDFSLMGGVDERVHNCELGCDIYFRSVTYWAPTGDVLSAYILNIY
jgi:hypothetical protein